MLGTFQKGKREMPQEFEHYPHLGWDECSGAFQFTAFVGFENLKAGTYGAIRPQIANF